MTRVTKERILGIDLGTTSSQAAIFEGGKATIIPCSEYPPLYLKLKMFPSVVGFTEKGEITVGETARRRAFANPDGTVFAAKRRMGSSNKLGVFGKEYVPQQISAFILQKIKKDAEAFLGTTVKKAVITVPAHFNDNQRRATKDAAEIAGFEVERIINEPTAACFAYGLYKLDTEIESKKILVFNFGGGTHDVTVMDWGQGVCQVLSTRGNAKVGGIDVDKAVTDFLVGEFKKQTGVDVTNNKNAMNRLEEAAEKAKIELTYVLSTEIDLPFLCSNDAGPHHLRFTLTRTQLESLAQPVIQKIEQTIMKALEDANMNARDIEKILLVGGMTRMPMIQRFVEQILRKPPEYCLDPMECVAIGAALQGAVLAGDVTGILLLDVTPLSLGIETLGHVFTSIIKRNTTIPTKKSQIFSTEADFQTAVTIHVLQGERAMAKDNVSLGQFNLMGIPPAPRGVPQIKVTFEIDADGILTVSAKDTGTEKQANITINSGTRLSVAEKEKMKKHSERYAKQYEKKKEQDELGNEIESLISLAEKNLVRHARNEKARAKIDFAINKLKDATASNNLEKKRKQHEELKKVLLRYGHATSEIEKLIKDHFHRVIKVWPKKRGANWARGLVQRIEQQELSTISLLAYGKMRESLSDGERHSTAISTDDLYITISTFPCSLEEAQRIHYPKGYLNYLDRMVSIARQENPRCHWLHFQFFNDGETFWVQFTLFPNKNVLGFEPMYHLPTDLLSDEEKKKVGLA